MWGEEGKEKSGGSASHANHGTGNPGSTQQVERRVKEEGVGRKAEARTQKEVVPVVTCRSSCG